MSTWWKTLLNLPDDKPAPTKKSSKEVTSTSSWDVATAPRARTGSTAWEIEKEPRGMRGWLWLLRVLVVGTLLILSGLGVVRIIQGNPEPPEYTIPATVTVDTDAATATAMRFAENYLTWDQTAPEEHAAAIARDWADAGDGGWNKRGKQTATDASVLAVFPLDANRVDVSVLIWVVPGVLDEEETPAEPHWVALKVATLVSDTRASVIDTPIFIGVPPADSAPTHSTPVTDPALTDKTRDMAARFFASYASGDVSEVAAPGATIVAPLTSAEATVSGWTVYVAPPVPTQSDSPASVDSPEAGTTPEPDSERQATAVVTWTEGEVTTTQTYQVTISLVSGQTESRWQVSALN